MKKIIIAAAVGAISMLGNVAYAADDWIIKDSPHTVSMTADKLVSAVEGAGATLFARIDHQAGAKKIGAEMPGATLVIFGNPKLGTPIMKSNIKAGLDLPIRVLIWEEGGSTKLGTLSPEHLKQRYDIKGADGALTKMKGALGKLLGAAAK